MTHISHMPTDAREAFEAGDLELLKAMTKEKAEFCRSIENATSVPYDQSAKYTTPGAYWEAQKRQESAMFDGVITLMGVCNPNW